MSSVIDADGTVKLPPEIIKELGLSEGEEISFLTTEDGVVLVPIKKLEELVDPKNKEAAMKIIAEIKKERETEANLNN